MYGIKFMEQCIFCNIIAGKIPSYKVYEDNLFFAILDINPANPGHIVLMPKNHISSIMEMSEEQMQSFFLVARRLALAVLEFGGQGVNFLYSLGEAAGQRSPHMIMHIIPRYKNDSVRFVWEPKKFSEEDFKMQQQKISSLVGRNVAASNQQVQKPPVVEEKPVEKKIYTLEPFKGGYWY